MHKLFEVLDRTPTWERRFARKFQLKTVARMNALLERSGLSQKEVVERTGWSKGYVSRLLSGGGNVTLKTLARFEDAIDQDVLAVTEDPKPVPRVMRVAVERHTSPALVDMDTVRRTIASTAVRNVTVYAGGDE